MSQVCSVLNSASANFTLTLLETEETSTELIYNKGIVVFRYINVEMLHNMSLILIFHRQFYFLS